MTLDKTTKFRITKHNIFCSLILILQNKKVKNASTKKYLKYVLHEKVKLVLKGNKNFSDKDIEKLEASIFRDAENFSDYEVIIDVPLALYNSLKGQEETDLIFDNYIVVIPNSILNALICEELEKIYSRADILSCGCFVNKQIQDNQGIVQSVIRLDIDEKYNCRGFIMPKFEGDLITELLIFRHPNDKYPFTLRARNQIQGGENGKRRILQTY